MSGSARCCIFGRASKKCREAASHLRVNGKPVLPFTLKQYGNRIRSVSCGGESGPEARICDFSWILDTHMQCVEYGVPFHFHQTGARLRRRDKVYDIPRGYQHEQAKKAQLDFDGRGIQDWEIEYESD